MLSSLSNANDGNVLAELRVQALAQSIGPKPPEFVGRNELGAFSGDLRKEERPVGLHALNDQRPQSQPGHRVSGDATRVALLDPSGKAALGANGDAACIRGSRASQKAVRYDQLVEWPQWRAGRWDFLRHSSAGKAPAAPDPALLRERLSCGGKLVHFNSENIHISTSFAKCCAPQLSIGFVHAGLQPAVGLASVENPTVNTETEH